MTVLNSHDEALPWRAGLAYGLLGLPLAFAALPLYVVLPHHYAQRLGLPLATVGALLMAVRLIDASTEPLLGRISDWLYKRTARSLLWVAGAASVIQSLGMAALFLPQVEGYVALSFWMVAGLLITCAAHSLLVIAHQAWGVRLGGDDAQRSRIVAWREGHGLIGVVAASALSVVWGPAVMVAVFAFTLVLGWLAWWRAPRPAFGAARKLPRPDLWRPLRMPDFRRLLTVFMCNGIASAVPAALMLFFAQDRLQASEAQIALFLVLYFVCGALSMPLWLHVVRKLGLTRAWLAGMLLAVACFGWTASLASGQVLTFAVICALTGIALGADLALPGALLARLIENHGARGQYDGAYLGWWNLATKLNLAIAAGAMLPLLQWAGYVPGSRDALALARLAWAYALLPCVLKLLAGLLLYGLLIRRERIPDLPRKVTT